MGALLDTLDLIGVKNSLRYILNKMGLEVFTLKKLPFGVNHLRDIGRMGKLHDLKVIFDVGANIGQTSTHLRNVFKKAEIYAFEPVHQTYQELNKKLLGADVKTVNIGFGDAEEKKRIFLQRSSILNSLVDSLNKPNRTGTCEEVEISTIDNFCAKNKIESISLLKIDTEGFGLKVLCGAEHLLKKASIEAIFIEVGFDENDKRHDSFFEVNKVLSEYSFRLVGFYDQRIENAKLEYCNAFFMLKK